MPRLRGSAERAGGREDARGSAGVERDRAAGGVRLATLRGVSVRRGYRLGEKKVETGAGRGDLCGQNW